MNFTEEQLLAQFAALSADDVGAEAVGNPSQQARERNWGDCLLMKVTSPNLINEGAFSVALRKSWSVHPDTIVEGLGSNFFLVQFLVPMEMLRIAAKGVWKLSKGDMVVTRQARGDVDLIEPVIGEADIWVELHGIPPDLWELSLVKSLMGQLGEPLHEVTTHFHNNKRVYRQKLTVNILEPLKPKLPLTRKNQQVCWTYVVYENVANVCRFCATIGHEHVVCPVRYKMIQMQQEEQYKKQFGNMKIPETKVGKWITDKTLIPRESYGLAYTGPKNNAGQTSSIRKNGLAGKTGAVDRSKKRPMNSNEEGMSVLFLEGGSSFHDEEEGDGDYQPLNCKRARETIPNSSPNSQ